MFLPNITSIQKGVKLRFVYFKINVFRNRTETQNILNWLGIWQKKKTGRIRRKWRGSTKWILGKLESEDMTRN